VASTPCAGTLTASTCVLSLARALDSQLAQMHSWSRDSVPEDVRSGSPRPSTWGQADYQVPSGGCNPATNFRCARMGCPRWARTDRTNSDLSIMISSASRP
jgi:hypothetical protein